MTAVYDTIADALAVVVQSTAATLGLPVAYDNMPFSVPADGGPFMSFSVGWEPTELVAVGTQVKFRTTGQAVASFHVPLLRGDADAREWAQTLAEAMVGTIGPARIFDSSISQLGAVGAYYVVQVSIDFVAFDTEAKAAPTSGQHTSATVSAAIRQHWIATVATPLSVLTVYDNQPEPPLDSGWVRLSVQTGSQGDELGGGLTEGTGIVTVAVMHPIERGTDDPLALAGAVVSAFRARTVQGVRYGSPSLTRTGRVGRWWQVTVTCPFEFQHA